MYTQTTRSITVSVQPTFREDQSVPNENRFVWAYRVRIENHGAETVQLVSRHWKITDAFGRTQEVTGDGVVGQQPVLQPGRNYEYTSGTPLATPTGFMGGTYQMETSSGERFDVQIPLFSLDSPHQQSRLN